MESRENATVGELASLMRIDRTTLNRNMKPLVKAGFITLNPGQDSRTRQIQLTQDGKGLCGQAWGLWGEAQASLKEYLGKENLRKLTHLLAKLEALVP
ncbi:MarR family winged helix-turn-helix transcriptional regulator [Sporomusa acidovorans]|uniref:HTH marR-type domain-containing protein n=1 Tax=Sporomusa acidovorans (strain ATCC 49682 / DSM 3132 / Mol) TaxID=1123286 RepID=A0ABZ3J4Q1_SPOA4|nr:MarR family winged helix-turn-helix transcriptional regulator [Sporomusa acidovorans]OZC18090.1 MarR family protein [Sporomusa acidovorans DSM 3132]SDF78234.1 DNA-binding transcriptional regulator, MarR family [Sporomusa acidovorans]